MLQLEVRNLTKHTHGSPLLACDYCNRDALIDSTGYFRDVVLCSYGAART